MFVSGAQARMEKNPGYYHNVLVEGKKNAKLVDTVITGNIMMILVHLPFPALVLGKKERKENENSRWPY